MLPPPQRDHPDVGAFEQGTPTSRWALGRYLVGRAIGEFVSRALTVFALLQGAPFWFQLLTKLVNLRSSGPPPAPPSQQQAASNGS